MLRVEGYYQNNNKMWVLKMHQKAIFFHSALVMSCSATTKKMTWQSPPTYYWKVKVDFNKNKYRANEVSTENIFYSGSDRPWTSYNSKVPAKAMLLQKLLQHQIQSEIVIQHFAELKCLHLKCQSRCKVSPMSIPLPFHV